MVADFAFSLWLSNKIEKDFGFPAIISLFPIMFAIMYVADGIINYFK